MRGKSSPITCTKRSPSEDGDKAPDTDRDLVRIAVVERHGKNGNIATGFVRGFGLKAGAIASTVCHDHHNIACVGVDYADMALAANRLSEIEGGFVVTRDGAVLAELALPVAGLMSLSPFEEVHDRAGGSAGGGKITGGEAGGAVFAVGFPRAAGDPGAEDHRPGDGRCGEVRDYRVRRAVVGRFAFRDDATFVYTGSRAP